jgi:hypothetical protein
MINAPLKNRADVAATEEKEAMGSAIGAARSVEKRHGKKR